MFFKVIRALRKGSILLNFYVIVDNKGFCTKKQIFHTTTFISHRLLLALSKNGNRDSVFNTYDEIFICQELQLPQIHSEVQNFERCQMK